MALSRRCWAGIYSLGGQKLNVLGVIPARGGSKGIPNKNLIPLGGKCLIQYTLDAALNAGGLIGLVVSTDSESIAAAVKQEGVAVIRRPTELSTDTAPTHPVIQHALSVYEASTGNVVDAVMLLQPTSPLRSAADISNALRLFIDSQPADSLISCYDGSGVHPEVVYKINGNRLQRYLFESTRPKRRQDFDPVVVRNGAIYISSKSLINSGSSLIGESPLAYLMPRSRSVNIDKQEDLLLAEFFLSRHSLAN